MHDDLYCTLVYQQFAFNPLLRDIANQDQQGMPWKERIGLIEGCSIVQDYLDQSVQAYLRDAQRILNLKVYRVDLYHDGLSQQQCDEINQERAYRQMQKLKNLQNNSNNQS